MSRALRITHGIVAPAATALAAAAVAMNVTVAAHAGINGEQCTAVVPRYLDRLGIDAGTVEKIGIAPIVGNPRACTYREYQAWVTARSPASRTSEARRRGGVGPEPQIEFGGPAFFSMEMSDDKTAR